jgi:hypothetical protein
MNAGQETRTSGMKQKSDEFVAGDAQICIAA